MHGLWPRERPAVLRTLVSIGSATTGNLACQDGKRRYDVKRRIYGVNPMRTYLLREAILGSDEA
jgi:hypothetical protein